MLKIAPPPPQVPPSPQPGGLGRTKGTHFWPTPPPPNPSNSRALRCAPLSSRGVGDGNGAPKYMEKRGDGGAGGGSGNAAPSGAVAGPAPGSLQSDAIGGVTGPLRRFPTCICHCVPGAVCRCLLAPRCLSRTSLLLLPLPARPRPPGPQPACTAALGRTRTRVAS